MFQPMEAEMASGHVTQQKHRLPKAVFLNKPAN